MDALEHSFQGNGFLEDARTFRQIVLFNLFIVSCHEEDADVGIGIADFPSRSTPDILASQRR